MEPNDSKTDYQSEARNPLDNDNYRVRLFLEMSTGRCLCRSQVVSEEASNWSCRCRRVRRCRSGRRPWVSEGNERDRALLLRRDDRRLSRRVTRCMHLDHERRDRNHSLRLRFLAFSRSPWHCSCRTIRVCRSYSRWNDFPQWYPRVCTLTIGIPSRCDHFHVCRVRRFLDTSEFHSEFEMLRSLE